MNIRPSSDTDLAIYVAGAAINMAKVMTMPQLDRSRPIQTKEIST